MGFSFIVLTTFYPAAQRAVHYADNLASALGGRLVLLHVNRSSVNGLYAFAGEAWKQEELKLATQTSSQLQQMAKQLHTPATVELATDLLPTVAQDLAQRYPAALFVVGLSDADTPTIERLCATALELLRAAQQPVLVVPRSTRAASPPRRVLLAADQEAFTLPNAAAVNELLRGLGAELTVAHVSTVEDDAGCAQALQAVEASGLSAGLSTVNLRGYLHLSPAAGLLEALVDTQADLLLVVARSRSYLGELFHRSVTAQVLANCTVPILILPVQEPAKNKRTKSGQRTAAKIDENQQA
jgi:nucleotide-binding universal stress UspA family protein